MSQPTLPDLDLFLAVARSGSFTQAARERGLTRSAVSHAMRDLEQRLDIRLFNRTTRSVAPTQAGLALLEKLTPAMTVVAEALAQIDDHHATPHGTLRLNMGRQTARMLARMLPAFARRYPDIQLDIVTDDGFIDIVRDGFDAGIRLGEALALDMIAVPFGPPLRLLPVASPDYLARHPTPQVPSDLLNHRCVIRRFASGSVYRWEFEKDGRAVTVAVDGPFVFDDIELVLAAVRNGLAIAYMFEDRIRDDLASGRLVPLLEDWTPPFPGYYLYYPSTRQMPRALRALVDFIRDFDGWG